MNTVLMKSQAYDLDEMAIKIDGISSKDLMRQAGKKIADFIKKNFPKFETITIVAGKGNNGGDGLSAALHLKKYNYSAAVFSLYDKDILSKDCLFFYNKCVKNSISITHFSSPPSMYDLSGFVVDSILGIGFKGELNDNVRKWTNWINSFSVVLSCDIPTGIDSDTGKISIDSVKADYTIAMGFPKIGSIIEPGKSYSGQINSVDIGFPNKINQLNGIKWNIITNEYIKNTLKPLNRDTHKYKQGKVLILAGSDGMTGAAYLATMGALRSGCGITKTFTPKSLRTIYERKITEGMTITCEDNGIGYFSENNFSQIMDHVEWADAILIGPGLGKNVATVELLKMLYKSINKPLVIDADGFSPFYEDISFINKIKNKHVMTPHIGELSNLFDVESEEIKNDLIGYIGKITIPEFSVMVAKGAPSLISDGKYGYINSRGNPGLATAGTGDVLSGVIASFISQGYNILESTIISTYIHGYAADKKSQSISERGMIASDLLIEIGKKLSEYEL